MFASAESDQEARLLRHRIIPGHCSGMYLVLLCLRPANKALVRQGAHKKSLECMCLQQVLRCVLVLRQGPSSGSGRAKLPIRAPASRRSRGSQNDADERSSNQQHLSPLTAFQLSDSARLRRPPCLRDSASSFSVPHNRNLIV